MRNPSDHRPPLDMNSVARPAVDGGERSSLRSRRRDHSPRFCAIVPGERKRRIAKRLLRTYRPPVAPGAERVERIDQGRD